MKRTPEVDVPKHVYEAIGEMRACDLKSVSKRGGQVSTVPTVISVIKDEVDILPDFLRHYREGGIRCFAFIDNGSTDGTTDYLSDQPDVILFSTDRPFVWQRKQGWIYLAIMMLGRGKDTWFIYADADEHIVYDGFPELGFGELAQGMADKGLSRVRGMLVDMYAPGPLLKSTYARGNRLSDAYPLFDPDGYLEADYPQIISRKGGPRQRIFGHVDKDFRPELTKYPLFKLVMNDVFANPHHIWPYHDNFASPCYLGILHYKFQPSIAAKIARALNEKNYWSNSIEYRCYDCVLRERPDLSLSCDESRIYTAPQSLIDCGIISVL